MISDLRNNNLFIEKLKKKIKTNINKLTRIKKLKPVNLHLSRLIGASWETEFGKILKPKNKLQDFITLKEQPCVLDNLTCYEYPDINALNKLIRSDLLYTVEHKNKKKIFGEAPMSHDTEREQLEKYRDRIDENGAVKILYKKYSKIQFGRVYGSTCAISMRKLIRGTLFNKDYVDLDIVNCHCHIYFQIAALHKIECPRLEEYVNDRETVRQMLMNYYNIDKKTAKNLILRYLYLGSFKNWAVDFKIRKTELPWLVEIKKELILIATTVLKCNPLLVEKVKQKKENFKMSSHKLLCSTISYFNQEIECRIIEKIYLYCVSKELIKNGVCCLCYDGIMILRNKYKKTLLNEFSDLIMDEIGLKVLFEQNEIESYTSILDDHIKHDIVRNVININERYLLDKDKLLNDNTPFVDEIKKFVNDKKIKFLTLKSPYDTGKSQMIKSLMHDYEFKKVLIVSYRITLSYEFQTIFSQFDFKNYKDGDFKCDRLINQTESLLRLIDDSIIVPQYDLILMDECESILRQFSSPTFKNGTSAKSFELLIKLCQSSRKVIAMDGDLGTRTEKFVDYIHGDSINIVNNVNFNNKTLNILHGSKEALRQFEKHIIDDLNNNLKIVIPCLSATYALELKSKIEAKFPQKKLLLYTSSTNDEEKKKDIKELWINNIDVLLYTPTIEAGLSLDMIYYDRLYLYICGSSCCQSAAFQMMARVRKFKEDQFYIYSDLPVETDGKKWTFEEVDNNSLYNKDVVLDNEYVFDNDKDEYKIVRKNELYRQIYIHNLVEDKNKHNQIYMNIFIQIAKSKGFKIKLHKVEKVKGDSNKDLSQKYLEILEAENIDVAKYEEYMILQKKCTATKKQKLAIQKYLIIAQLGIDNLDYDDDSSKENAYNIIKRHNYSTLKNYMALIDTRNINNVYYENNKLVEKHLTLDDRAKLKMVEYTNQILIKLGFDNCCDKKEIQKDNFIKKCNAVCALLVKLSTEDSIFNQMFNVCKDDLNYLLEKDLGAQMRRINVMLSKCGIKISDTRKSKHKNNQTYCLHDIDFLSETLSNKIMRQTFKLHDTNKIFEHVELNYFKEYINTDAKIKADIDIDFIED